MNCAKIIALPRRGKGLIVHSARSAERSVKEVPCAASSCVFRARTGLGRHCMVAFDPMPVNGVTDCNVRIGNNPASTRIGGVIDISDSRRSGTSGVVTADRHTKSRS